MPGDDLDTEHIPASYGGSGGVTNAAIQEVLTLLKSFVSQPGALTRAQSLQARPSVRTPELILIARRE